MKALVTGGNGFIGSHLVELLLSKGYAVRCLVRRTSDLRWLTGLNIELVHGDLFDDGALKTAVEGVDFVYHSAGITKAKTKAEYYRGNAAGTGNLLKTTVKHNPGLKRFVHISSQAAVGPSPSSTPLTEEAPAHPITTYGKSKWEAEEECLAIAGKIPITIVRPPVVYGPRDKDVFEFFNTYSKGLQPMVGFGEKFVSMIHVADLVRGFVMAGESAKASGHTYFITSRRTYGWREIGDVTRKAMNKKALRVRIPEAGVYVVSAFAEFFSLFSSKPALINFEKAKDMVQDYWTCDSSKAKRDFGYEQQISLEAGIRDTVSWYKTHKWLR
jgi:dihydroflavonol-4-reductase